MVRPEICPVSPSAMGLQPGDIISVGTPPGDGMRMQPQTYLETGDVIEPGVEGLGEQHHVVITDPEE